MADVRDETTCCEPDEEIGGAADMALEAIGEGPADRAGCNVVPCVIVLIVLGCKVPGSSLGLISSYVRRIRMEIDAA